MLHPGDRSLSGIFCSGEENWKSNPPGPSALNFQPGEGDDDYLPHGSESYVTNHRHLQELQRLAAFQQVTTKVSPSDDGRSHWFAYEGAIDDRCDITESDGDKRGPALIARVRAFVAGLPAEEQEGLTNEEAMEKANERLRDQHARTIPITANLVALIFVPLSDLTQDQRLVLTSLMAHRNRVLADCRLSELREVYLRIAPQRLPSIILSSLPLATVSERLSWRLRKATWTLKKAIGSRMKGMAHQASLKLMMMPFGSTTKRTTRGFKDISKEGR